MSDIRILNNMTSSEEDGLGGVTLIRFSGDVDVQTLLSEAKLGNRAQLAQNIGEQIVRHFEDLELMENK